jgi:hypothetical protein
MLSTFAGSFGSSTQITEHGPGLSNELTHKMRGLLVEGRKRMPIRNKLALDVATRSILSGNKRRVSKRWYDLVFKTEFNKLKTQLAPRSRHEKRALKSYLTNTMHKMYIVS